MKFRLKVQLLMLDYITANRQSDEHYLHIESCFLLRIGNPSTGESKEKNTGSIRQNSLMCIGPCIAVITEE